MREYEVTLSDISEQTCLCYLFPEKWARGLGTAVAMGNERREEDTSPSHGSGHRPPKLKAESSNLAGAINHPSDTFYTR